MQGWEQMGMGLAQRRQGQAGQHEGDGEGETNAPGGGENDYSHHQKADDPGNQMSDLVRFRHDCMNIRGIASPVIPRMLPRTSLSLADWPPPQSGPVRLSGLVPELLGEHPARLQPGLGF